MNTFPPREIVERLRLQYPAGCRVELVSMDDPYFVESPPAGPKVTRICICDMAMLEKSSPDKPARLIAPS